MFGSLSECHCKMTYNERGIFGHPIHCYYHGEGIWQCPECGEIYDHSGIVYTVIITYTREIIEMEELLQIYIKTEDERLFKIIDPKYPERKNIDAMLEDLYEALECKKIDFHEGTYLTEILWYWYRTTWEYEEYDLEMSILSEQKIGEEQQ